MKKPFTIRVSLFTVFLLCLLLAGCASQYELATISHTVSGSGGQSQGISNFSNNVPQLTQGANWNIGTSITMTYQKKSEKAVESCSLRNYSTISYGGER